MRSSIVRQRMRLTSCYSHLEELPIPVTLTIYLTASPHRYFPTLLSFAHHREFHLCKSSTKVRSRQSRAKILQVAQHPCTVIVIAAKRRATCVFRPLEQDFLEVECGSAYHVPCRHSNDRYLNAFSPIGQVLIYMCHRQGCRRTVNFGMTEDHIHTMLVVMLSNATGRSRHTN
jgi:hypothetical protein